MNDHTLLLRQIHPSFVQEGRPSSQAFRPTPKDEKKLSVYDGDQISPAAAFQHYCVTLNLASSGVQAVSVEECHSLILPTSPDPTHFKEHALIDFSSQNDKDIQRKSKILKANAAARGWLT
ncbi:hypothetical protein [Halothiobacillus sp.]|uniref:hypothetical protein n=1 Tax=Halothiobacillus sp. TaxID=1891311 RepID=UPI002AD3FA78|nr:hypothetical protein [Halothiobacillus sp.]